MTDRKEGEKLSEIMGRLMGGKREKKKPAEPKRVVGYSEAKQLAKRK